MTSTIFTVKVVVTVVIGSWVFAAWACIVARPPRCGGSVVATGNRVVNVGEPSAGKEPTR